MSILVDQSTRLLVQGMGREGRFHADNRQGKARAQRVDCHSCRGVTGDDDRLGVLADQELRDGDRSLFDEWIRSVAVRRVCGIRDVQQILAGKLLPDLSQHGQDADTGIEHANRAGVHARGF